MLVKQHLILFILSLCLGGAGAWAVNTYGHRMALVARPNERSSHRYATPNGGGVGILAGFMTGAIVLKLPAAFWIPAAILSAISFAGDRFEISFLIRLVAQFVASFIFLFGIVDQQTAVLHSHLILILAAIFMVGTANYYNFMDGINGIAGITGIVGFGLLAIFAHNSNIAANLVVLNIVLTLCCLGFLPFNVPRARVFMGDVGSILLGFVYAAMVIWCSRSLLDFLCLVSILFPFYADEVTTEVIRLKDGEKLWRPHRRHLYQILANECQIAHWKVSIGYGIVQLFVGVSVMFCKNSGMLAVLFIIFLYLCIFTVISNAIRQKVAGGTS
ncbi:MAG: glycosyltransferase family 4 protein [Desulfobacterales bacterium]|nr:MAG: glycosyltransferase family 4 protein [Desulfobacterales bacterium]